MRRQTRVSFVLLSMIGLVLAPFSLPAQEAGGGRSSGQETSGFRLEQNYPNPFNPETTIPFVLNEDLFVDGRPVEVSMRIYNLLRQPVATPVPLRHPAGEGPLQQIEYTLPGRYEAFWDGKDGSGRSVASGVYFLQLTVNGQSKHIRIIITK
jgi:hypothetical protein